ncbi:hypothetical protein DFJ74DRAFT_642262 [Hyaloraphidium curvatum]|nr:hypothetical protein DFJ74DRAFT_642262 [Hyaloraphidium curvatum]
MAPRRPARNDDLIRAARARELDSQRRRRADQFAWKDAARRLEEFREQITGVDQLARVGLRPAQLRELTNVLLGLADVGVPGPTAEELRRAAARKQPEEYTPLHRSGPYAILLVLADGATLTKEEIIARAQPLCSSSFQATRNDRWRSAWDGNQTLAEHGYIKITKQGPGVAYEYRITDAGRAAVARIRRRDQRVPGAPPTPDRSPPPMPKSKGAAKAKRAAEDSGTRSPTPQKRAKQEHSAPEYVAADRDAVRDSWARRTDLQSAAGPSHRDHPVVRDDDVSDDPAGLEPCPNCGASFRSAVEAVYHIDSCPGRAGPSEFPVRVIAPAADRAPRPMESDLFCPICGATFAHEEALFAHAEGCAAEDGVVGRCHRCSRPFRDQAALLRHSRDCRSAESGGPQAAPTRAGAAAARPAAQPLTISVLVDKKERTTNDVYLRIYHNVEQRLREAEPQLPPATFFAAENLKAHIGDYLFLRNDLPGSERPDDEVFQQQSFVLPLAIERKTQSDLVGRSHPRHHITQLEKLNRPDIRHILPRHFWLIEGLNLKGLNRHTAYHNGDRDRPVELRRGEKLDSADEWFALVCELLLRPDVHTKVVNVQDEIWTAALCTQAAKYFAEVCRDPARKPADVAFKELAKACNKKKDLPAAPDLSGVGRLSCDTLVHDLAGAFTISRPRVGAARPTVYASKRDLPGSALRFRVPRFTALEFLSAVLDQAGTDRIATFAALSAACTAVLAAAIPDAPVAGERRILLLEGAADAVRRLPNTQPLDPGSPVAATPLDLLLACVLLVTEAEGWHVQMTSGGPMAEMFLQTLAWFLRPPTTEVVVERHSTLHSGEANRVQVTDKTNRKTYVDGVLPGTDAAAGYNLSNGPQYIGCTVDLETLDGELYAIAFYGEALRRMDDVPKAQEALVMVG